MGLWSWLRRLLFGQPKRSAASRSDDREQKRRRPRARLTPLRHRQRRTDRWRQRDAAGSINKITVKSQPYRFAWSSVFGGFLDLNRDGDPARLKQAGLPVFQTPQELADWLQMPIGRLAWLVHRFHDHQRPATVKLSHYHYQWIAKRSGDRRLLEIPKPQLKAAQEKILREILDLVPTHSAAHGFVTGRSIKTNAEPHVGQRVVMKFDLENFYPSVKYSRVVAIYRSLGYSREAAIWLGRLTTSITPPLGTLKDLATEAEWIPYATRHLPQGAPTSPALANLSAFALDLRLAGLARTFHANYTRYADDLTFSGPDQFLRSLRVFIPLVMQLIRQERFRVKLSKRKVIRNSQQQRICGVVVNEQIGIPRREFDRLKAILTNCVRRGPATQNHERHPDFAAHLRGRIAHVSHLHSERGARLLDLFEQIDWNS
ncbi:MAG: RNA-directed DNA polymerase [Planctomycetales bacterium]|nr:RNA-directed DNA polymerase [Planctomycetales bacterium]